MFDDEYTPHKEREAMIPESQFIGLKAVKPKKSRKKRKNYTVIACRDAKARGRYRDGEGFNKFLKVDRKPTMIY